MSDHIFADNPSRGEISAPIELPYQDTKPLGAADFYFAINSTFRFIFHRLGHAALLRYWEDLGREYFAPVSAIWKTRGLAGAAGYWIAFHKTEPGAQIEVARYEDCVELHVNTCPAIRHLRAHSRDMLPCFCEHCYFVGEAIAAPAGFTIRIEGGNGECRQRIYPRASAPSPQDLSLIRRAGPC